jgi:hypothetical protein
MKALMFGWEFPPHISGGLGTACFGLTKALMKHDVEIIFVVPKAYGDEDAESIRLVNASDVVIDIKDEHFREMLSKMSYLEIDSTLIPYADDEEYFRITEQIEKGVKTEKLSIKTQKYSFSGGYGKNLMEEVNDMPWSGPKWRVSSNSTLSIHTTGLPTWPVLKPNALAANPLWCICMPPSSTARERTLTRWSMKLKKPVWKPPILLWPLATLRATL